MVIFRGGVEVSEEQENVVDHVIDNLMTVVAAGAGSGKTRTMIATVMELLTQSDDLTVDEFILITFTNKAANEMKGRLEGKINDRFEKAQEQTNRELADKWFNQKEYLANSFVGTIHGFCSQLLCLFGYENNIPYQKDIVIAKRYFREALEETIQEGYKDSDILILFHKDELALYELKKFLGKVYTHIRNKGAKIDNIVTKTLIQEGNEGKDIRTAIAKLLKNLNQNYNQVKKEEGKVDMNDLLIQTVQLLKKPENQELIGNFINKRYSYLFIDEFQDTDILQEQIITRLAPYLKGVLVVGDIKQSIYSFRGAEHTILKKIADKFDTEILSILISYRPSLLLHKVQNLLFEKMSEDYSFLRGLTDLPETPRNVNDNLLPFKFISTQNSGKDARAEVTIKEVRELLNQEIDPPDEKEDCRQVEPKDICILFRGNWDMNQYAKAFREEGLSIKIDTGGKFFKKTEIIDCFYMLNAILRYPNDLALDLAFNTNFLPISTNLPLLEDNNTNYLLGWLRKNHSKWFKVITKLRKEAKSKLVPEILQELYDLTKVKERYAKSENIQAVANLEKLISWSREQMHSEALTLQQFVDRLKTAVVTGEELDEAETEDSEEKNEIVFSTIHSAKGLEYPIVIIPEAQKPIFSEDKQPDFFVDEEWGLDISLPDGSGRSENFADLLQKYRQRQFDEEIRILYVAITRAQNAIRFISNENISISDKNSDFWSWKDEILKVRGSLESLGRQHVRFERR